MKICYVLENGDSINGSEQSLQNVISEMIKKDITIFVVCHKKRKALFEYFEKMGAHTAVIRGANPVQKVGKKSIRSIFKLFFIIFNIPVGILFLKNNQIDIVHANTSFVSPVLLIAAKLLRIPYIYHLREFQDMDHDMEFYFKKFFFQIMKGASYRIAISDEVKKVWEARIGSECEVIYNGIPFSNCYSQRNGIFEEKKLNLIVIGRVVASKGQKVVVEAVKKIVDTGFKDIHLDIVGYRGITDYEKDILKYIEINKLSDYIEIHNFTQELNEYRKKANIGIMCSKAEAFGRVTIEYMAAGLLVIGTNVGGTAEIIENNRTGILFEYGNSDQLVKVLQHVYMNSNEMEEIARVGQSEAIKKFSIEKNVKNIYGLYLKMMQV